MHVQIKIQSQLFDVTVTCDDQGINLYENHSIILQFKWASIILLISNGEFLKIQLDESLETYSLKFVNSHCARSFQQKCKECYRFLNREKEVKTRSILENIFNGCGASLKYKRWQSKSEISTNFLLSPPEQFKIPNRLKYDPITFIAESCNQTSSIKKRNKSGKCQCGLIGDWGYKVKKNSLENDTNLKFIKLESKDFSNSFESTSACEIVNDKSVLEVIEGNKNAELPTSFEPVSNNDKKSSSDTSKTFNMSE
ncbi:MAG: hypothetical protein MHPSP_002365 [Paramarteilia canceri]